MEQDAILCIPVFFSHSQMFTEDHSRQGRGSDHCTHVAYPDVLPQDNVHVDWTAKAVTEEGEPVKAATLPIKSPTMEENATDGMFEAEKVSEEARGIMLQSWRKSTQNQCF